MLARQIRPVCWWRFAATALVVLALSPTTVRADGIGTTIDGQYASIGMIGGGEHIDVVVVGRGGVPASGVAAVALNVTVTEPTASGFLTVWPTGQPRPSTSTLNFVAGQTVANMAVVPVGDDGLVTVFNYTGAAHVVVDVLGWFPAGSSFHGLAPARLADSRPGYPTIDGAASGTGPLGPGAERAVQVSGRGGTPTAGVGSVVLNVTATNPTASSFVRVWASGATRPDTSNLNVVAGQTAANMVIAPVGADGRVDLYNYAGSTDLVVDVLGWFPSGSGVSTVTPGRLLDTRPSSPTVDGHDAGGGPLGPGAAFGLPVTGRAGVPGSGVAAVALNVTATAPTAAGFITVWPTGTDRPNASNLNFTAGQTIANMVIVPVGPDGRVTIGNYDGDVDVVVDVLGWFPAGGDFVGLAPARLVDTRPVPTQSTTADPDLLAGSRVLCTFHGPVVPDDVLGMIRVGRASGVILFRENLPSKDQAQRNAAAIEAAAAQSPDPAPAIIAVDQEGGQVTRVDGPPTMSAAELGTQPSDVITEQGRETGLNLRTWGINVNLAPVADVARPNSFEAAQQRSFGSRPDQVATAVSAFVTGLHAGGVAATLKHFPGLGAAAVNTDNAPAVISLDEATLESVDEPPFAAGIGAGTDLVMIASAIYPTLGPRPAVLSPAVINRVLRQDLGFTGVTISDALDTPALAGYGSPASLAVTAAPAVDLFITSQVDGCSAIHHSIAAAITAGTLGVDGAQAAYRRIHHLRAALAANPPVG